jgi:hypothetical protein
LSFGEPWFYIVLLGAAALVYALLLPGRQSAAAPKAEMARELEATLEQYMAEIENENQELIDMVAQMKQDFVSKQLAQQEQIAELRRRLGDTEASAKQCETRLVLLESAMAEQTAGAAALGQGATLQVLPPQDDVAAATESESQPLAQPSLPEEPEPAQEQVRDRYPELFDLYDKGKSIDMIAKTMGLQRGEVQLILQLAKKEESR